MQPILGLRCPIDDDIRLDGRRRHTTDQEKKKQPNEGLHAGESNQSRVTRRAKKTEPQTPRRLRNAKAA
jgi:hypothetical protein